MLGQVPGFSGFGVRRLEGGVGHVSSWGVVRRGVGVQAGGQSLGGWIGDMGVALVIVCTGPRVGALRRDRARWTCRGGSVVFRVTGHQSAGNFRGGLSPFVVPSGLGHCVVSTFRLG